MNTTSRRIDASALRSSWARWANVGGPAGNPGWLQAAWTVAFAAAIALVFTLLMFLVNVHTLAQWLEPGRWARQFLGNLVVSLAIGFVIQGLFLLARATLGPARLRALAGWRSVAFYSLTSMLGTAIGWGIGISLVFGDLHVLTEMSSANVVSNLLLALLISLLISVLFFVYFSMRVRQVKADARATDAQLRLLQGQMEPHFLFNTLATVISLIDVDAPRAKHVLEAFTDYLRASLGSLRRDDSTLGAELELATRFLHLMQARMGERLRFEIDVDASLRGAALPPLMLQPLVENAVKHGLEPQVDGGTVRVRATRVVVDGQDALQLCVDDDGAGLAASAARQRRPVAGGPDGAGIAIANLRERLQARFDTLGRLTLAALESPSGTRACLVVPWRSAAVGAPAPPAPTPAGPPAPAA